MVMSDSEDASPGRGMRYWQPCEMPECPNEVPKAKGICDDCAGVGGGADAE